MDYLEGKEIPPDQPILSTPAAWKAALPATDFYNTLTKRGSAPSAARRFGERVI